MFRKIFSYIILIACIAYGFFFYYTHRPCAQPITYRIGTMDSGFGITKATFLEDIFTASDIWNIAAGKKVFEYDPQGTVVINLKYDDRQKAVNLRGEIDKSNNVAQSVKDQFEALKSQYGIAKVTYEADVNQFNTEARSYSKEEFMIKKKVLDNQRIALNALASQIQTYVDKYNGLVRDINSNVNIVNKTAGEVEEGLYSSNPPTIDIYQYDSNLKFIRLITHELGHALGLDHNDNSESIMYKLNNGTSKKLSADDISDLKTICRL